ncbi:MAG: ribose 5-phosphate isomerase B [Deltaproteobacteria bacterium]|nr:ribose 5-phosphate isomerase B [Deltaproteobacteria bacterium]
MSGHPGARAFFVGSDHAGISLRRAVVAHLEAAGHVVGEFGPGDGERSDYPDAAREVALAVRRAAPADRAGGILICGTGIGMSIAANKVTGIRAALVHDPVTARLAAEHNDARVLCLGARLLAEDYALGLVDVWLAASFETRHQGRLDKVADLESAAHIGDISRSGAELIER